MAGKVAAWALSVLLTITGTLHFVKPHGFEAIVPHFLGDAAFWVRASGVAELGCALALAIPRTRRAGGLAAAVLFVVVFPANITMVVNSGGHSALAWARLPLQVPLILWALFVARRARTPQDQSIRS